MTQKTRYMAKKNLIEKAVDTVLGRKPEDEQEILLKQRADRYYDAATGARKEIDWKWFIYDLWVAGLHYAKWDRNTQQITTTVKDAGKAKIVINKVYTTLRAVRNYALRNRPKAEVTPVKLTEEAVGEVVKLNKYLDFLHDKLYLRRKLKETVWHSLKYSAGFWQVLWNEEAEDGEGEVEINVIDPYDIYWDPSARHPNEAKYVILAVRRYVDDIKEDSKYDKEKTKELNGDKLLAASPLKSRLLQAEKGLEIYNKQDKEGSTLIVKECWIKEKQEDNSTRVRIVAIADDKIIRNELTELKRFPFFKLACDVEPLSMYGQGWVKNLIPPNRALDRLESSLAEYNDLVNKGKYVSDKGAGVRVINNEHGQIIEKKRGFDVQQLPVPGLSPAIYTQIENMNRYIEDIGGAHDASLGRIPAGAKSGKALEALQAGDSNNMSEIVENVEEFLEEVYEYVLSLAAQKYQFARQIIPVSQSGEREFIKVIGEEAANKPEEATVIPSKNMVDVKITSWLAHTSEVRREILKELYELKAIDQQTLLVGYETGSVADIIQRTKEQKKEEQADELAMQNASGQVQNKLNAPPTAGRQQAIASIRSLMKNQPVEPPPAVTQDFVDQLDEFLSSPEAQKLAQSEPQVIEAVQNFRDSVVQSMGSMG